MDGCRGSFKKKHEPSKMHVVTYIKFCDVILYRTVDRKSIVMKII